MTDAPISREGRTMGDWPYRIDPTAPDPMNRFYGIDSPEEAQAILRRMIDGETFPEVTLWRLHSYCDNAVLFGELRERKRLTGSYTKEDFRP